MRAAVAMILPVLVGCSEPDPNFAVLQWEDSVEEIRSISESLYPTVGSDAPGEWAISMGQAKEGESSWHFGDGESYPDLASDSLQTPEFEAGRRSFLRFSYWSDLQPLSDDTTKDGLIVEGRIEDEEWIQLELNGGYPFTIDEITVGSQLQLGSGVIAGNDREWHDDWVEMPDAEVGQDIRFRFRFGSDIDSMDNIGEGLYIDAAEFLIVE